MSCYEALAGSYDALTEDVGYGKRLDFIEKLLCRSRIPVKLVLDLACGTGTMSWLLTQRGYEVIGVDGSEDMLAANQLNHFLPWRVHGKKYAARRECSFAHKEGE